MTNEVSAFAVFFREEEVGANIPLIKKKAARLNDLKSETNMQSVAGNMNE